MLGGLDFRNPSRASRLDTAPLFQWFPCPYKLIPTCSPKLLFMKSQLLFKSSGFTWKTFRNLGLWERKRMDESDNPFIYFYL